MSKICHIGLSVRGYLVGSNADCERLFKHPDGTWFTAREAKDHLCGELAAGREILPIGQPCEGWSFTEGCPGHDAPPFSFVSEARIIPGGKDVTAWTDGIAFQTEARPDVGFPPAFRMMPGRFYRITVEEVDAPKEGNNA